MVVSTYIVFSAFIYISPSFLASNTASVFFFMEFILSPTKVMINMGQKLMCAVHFQS